MPIPWCWSAASRATSAPTAPATGWGRAGAFVIEGDEYDSAYFDKTAKFLKYLPDIAVVNNIEFDHADIYPDLDAVRLAFRRLVNLVPRSGLTLLGADSPDAAALAPLARSRVQTFGLAEGADWRAVDVTSSGVADTTFRVVQGGRDHGVFTMPLLGDHNVRNALAAIAVGADLGLAMDALAPGLAQFKGVKRRLEVVGEARGVTVYDDFAHHPTAVEETLRAVAARFTGPAHLGGVRAALGLVVPARLSGRLRARVCRRRPGGDRVGVPVVAAEAERLSESQLVADLHARQRRGPPPAGRGRDCRRRGRAARATATSS